MTKKDLAKLQELLMRRREEVFTQAGDLENRWREMSEPQVEFEETAQEAEITESFAQLDELERREVREIDLALNKMASGVYGLCEACGKPITLKRLQAVPWTRFCREDAERHEKHPEMVPPAGDIRVTEFPDEFKGLTNEEIMTAIEDEIRRNGRIDTQELNIMVFQGIVYLKGSLPSEEERDILLQILSDVMGFQEIADLLDIKNVLWERPDRSPDGPQPVRPVNQEDLTEDVVESVKEGVPYLPPDQPIPEEEK